MKTINHDELAHKFINNEDFLLINVLPEEYFQQAHVPGSVNVPYDGNDSFTNDIEALAAAKDKDIVIYCLSELCDTSSFATETLIQSGFSNVADFNGGLQEWMESGKPLKTSGEGGCGGSCDCACD